MSGNIESLNALAGTSHILGPVSSGELKKMRLHSQMDNFRRPEEQLPALAIITELPRGRVYVACCEDTIVGYVAFHLPDEYSRWHQHHVVTELGGVEVAREWRRCGVGSTLLDYIFAEDYWEDYLVITTEYFRHWDMKGNNMTVWQYRDMMDKFFGRVGFVVKYTTDPDILEHPANAMMCRVGCRVGLDDIMLFEELATRRY